MDWMDFLAPMVKYPTEGVQAGVDWASGQMGSGGPLDSIPGMKSTPMPAVGGPNPYQGDWNSLIQMLRQRANGQGPSLAGDAYQTAYNHGMEGAATMSHGRGPGAAYGAAQAQGNLHQGLATGLAHARNEETMGATGALEQALQGGGQAWLGPQQLSLQAWATQNGLDIAKLQALASLFGGAARTAGGVPSMGGGGMGTTPGFDQSMANGLAPL